MAVKKRLFGHVPHVMEGDIFSRRIYNNMAKGYLSNYKMFPSESPPNVPDYLLTDSIYGGGAIQQYITDESDHIIRIRVDYIFWCTQEPFYSRDLMTFLKKH